MRLPASGSWWSEQILDTVPNERFCARDLKESKSDRTHPAAFLCVKRSLQSRGIGQICVFLMPMKLVIIELPWRDNKGLLSRGANLPV